MICPGDSVGWMMFVALDMESLADMGFRELIIWEMLQLFFPVLEMHQGPLHYTVSPALLNFYFGKLPSWA